MAADGDVPLLHDGVHAYGLLGEKLIVFITVFDLCIVASRKKNGVREALPVKVAVAKGDLHTAAAFLCVKKRAVDMEFLLLFRPAG